MKRLFTKVEAAGNDFLFSDYNSGALTSEEIRLLCDRNFGIGADGLVAMESLTPESTRWHFFNRDGSIAAMCGNAARAAAAWLFAEGKALPHRLQTGFGEVLLSRVGSDFEARVPYAGKALAETALGGATLIDTGVPHAVIEWPSSVFERSAQMRERAAQFRWAKQAGVGGTNVTFFNRREGGIDAITFERGVEDFTLSCGTGVLAAATVSSAALTRGWPSGGVIVRNPGAELKVVSSDFPSSLTLIGPARVVFRAEWES
ncbi:MAG: diaminopimelate epimerase [Bdellovibrionaceae bacterium]|nr:diaminopimelate epimerase [Pseudobdellovibrionaceae bacterium]